VRAWDEPTGPKILTTLLTKGRVNEVANGKAYEMTSNFVGLLELYRATGEASYLQAVQRAWDDIVKNRRYLTGTASWAELYRGDHLLRADGKVGEGCVTTTWMQVNLKLLELTGEARYADELERSAVDGYFGNAELGKTPMTLVLVPIADAGQTGGEYRTWLQRP
jgi:uncharacterized protein